MEVDDSLPHAAKVKRMKDDKTTIWQETSVLCWGAHALGQLGLGTVKILRDLNLWKLSLFVQLLFHLSAS